MNIIERSKKITKILSINFVILMIFLFCSALLFRFSKEYYLRFVRLFNQISDERVNYPTYSNKKFSTQLFNENQKMSSKYMSFMGWRMEKENFKYINISGPYNVRKSLGEEINNSTWFFGGSTMWGTGSSDSQTIPSHFSSITNTPVYNFGERGWNSRQSLNQLINAIGDGHKPSVVIFYDGVNDVIQQCRSEIKLLPAHSREKQIKNALKPLPLTKRISNFILSQYISFAEKFSMRLPFVNQLNSKKYDCHINQKKAHLIAKHLLNNWKTAYAISGAMGFDFYGVLQPTLFTTTTNSEYFSQSKVKINSQIKVQYDIVYPLILKEIVSYCESDKNFCSSIINGIDWLDGTNNIFIDYCHVNSLGNKVIAKRMKSFLKR